MTIKDNLWFQGDLFVRQARRIENLAIEYDIPLKDLRRDIIEMGVEAHKAGKGITRVNIKISEKCAMYIKNYAHNNNLRLNRFEREITQLGINKFERNNTTRETHPYANIIAETVRNNVWEKHQNAKKPRSRQVLYSEIGKQMRKIVDDPSDIGGITAPQIREYFKGEGYKTATYSRLSVDELIERFGGGGTYS